MKLSLVILSLLLLSGPLFAAKPKKQEQTHNGAVIDLGQIEVEGEVRRPPIEWIDSNKRAKQNLLDLYERQFALLEKALLKPAQNQKKEASSVGR